MSIPHYLKHAIANLTGLPAGFGAQVESHLAALRVAVASADGQPAWQYQVPELGEGGACSLFGQLAAEPYDLEKTLGGKTSANQLLLQKATALIGFYRQHSQSDWFGIYQARSNLDSAAVLVKLAYFGAASRAEFPLTEEFARISNNSSVGISGKGRVINDVASYVTDGGEYYTCDPKVKSEACLPVLANDGRVLGIIDAEAFRADLYRENELALLIAVAVHLSDLL